MQELQIVDEQKINRIYELISTDELTRESFEGDLKEFTEKYKGYIATASTLKDDKAKRAEFNKLIKAKHRIRKDTKILLSETPNAWDEYAKAIIAPFEKVVSELDKSIKGIEDHQKAMRLDTVKAYLSNKAAEYNLDPRIFDTNANSFLKESDFMADGFTLKKATMKSLTEIVVAEFERQQELEKAQNAIAGQCSEYGMTDQPYLRMLSAMTLPEVLEQIKADYKFELQKAELRRKQEEDERRIEEQKARQQESVQKSTETPNFDPETGEILEGGQLVQNELEAPLGAENSQKRYTQKMTLEVYFENTQEKEFFKSELEKIGFVYKENYVVNGYKNIQPLTEDELRAELN